MCSVTWRKGGGSMVESGMFLRAESPALTGSEPPWQDEPHPIITARTPTVFISRRNLTATSVRLSGSSVISPSVSGIRIAILVLVFITGEPSTKHLAAETVKTGTLISHIPIVTTLPSTTGLVLEITIDAGTLMERDSPGVIPPTSSTGGTTVILTGATGTTSSSTDSKHD